MLLEISYKLKSIEGICTKKESIKTKIYTNAHRDDQGHSTSILIWPALCRFRIESVIGFCMRLSISQGVRDT